MILLKFFGIIILFFVVFFLVILASVIFRFWGIIRQFMGKGKPSSNGFGGFYQQGGFSQGGFGQGGFNQQAGGFNQQRQQSQQSTQNAKPTISGKVKPRNSEIDKNEGEYVDFEEIS